MDRTPPHSRRRAGVVCATPQAVAPTPEQRNALDWLPEAMSFPAVDPDAKACADEPDEDAIGAEAKAEDEGDAPEDAAIEDEPVREAA